MSIHSCASSLFGRRSHQQKSRELRAHDESAFGGFALKIQPGQREGRARERRDTMQQGRARCFRGGSLVDPWWIRVAWWSGSLWLASTRVEPTTRRGGAPSSSSSLLSLSLSLAPPLAHAGSRTVEESPSSRLFSLRSSNRYWRSFPHSFSLSLSPALSLSATSGDRPASRRRKRFLIPVSACRSRAGESNEAPAGQSSSSGSDRSRFFLISQVILEMISSLLRRRDNVTETANIGKKSELGSECDRHHRQDAFRERRSFANRHVSTRARSPVPTAVR